MFASALGAIKKFLGIGGDVRQPTKRPLEEESENEFEDTVTVQVTEPQQKKRCPGVDHSLTPADSTFARFSPVLMRFPWLSRRKEENPNPLPDENMSSHRSRKGKEAERGTDPSLIVVEEKVKKWSVPASTTTAATTTTPTSVPASHAPEEEDDIEILEMRETRKMSKMATRRPPLTHTPLADFRFVPSSMQSLESDVPAKRNRDFNPRSSRSFKFLSSKPKSDFRSPPGSVLDKLMGKRRTTGILSSRIKHSVVQKSFLHEEKVKYRQLLQQYTDYMTLNARPFSCKVSSVPSSPMGMVTHSQWTPFQTKEKQDEIESRLQVLSQSRPLPSADTPILDEVLGSKKIDRLVKSSEAHQKQKSTHTPIPMVDISQEDIEVHNASDKDSDSDSVILVKEVLSPQAQNNSLEERLKEHPVYDLNWVKTMRKEYEERAQYTKKDADTTARHIQELEQKGNRKIAMHEKVTQRLKLLDLTYPTKYTEIPDEEEEEPFVPLTPEMENEIDDALNKIPKSEVLIEKFHIQITRRDIKTLDGLNWLNDEVINFYMNLIMERSQKNDNYPKVYAFNTFFYPKLSKSGYQSVRRWTKKVDLFSHDMVLVPIHLGMHWCMCVIDFKMKCITYYDSMLGNNEWCLQLLMEYLESEHKDKKGLPYKTSVWKLEHKKDIPQQMNGSDCGMFSCKFADYLSRRAKVNFDQQHMPYFRRRMVYEIIKGRLL